MITDDLRRGKLIDLIKQLFLAIQLRHEIFARRNVCNRQTIAILHADNTHQIIISALIKRLRIQIRPRCHDSDDIPLHQPLRLLRILQLLTDRHLIAL